MPCDLTLFHNIFDYSAYNFLSKLSDHVHRYAHRADRHIFLIAESSLNDTKLIRPIKPVDMHWMHNGMMIFIMPCTPISLVNHNVLLSRFWTTESIVKALSEGYVLTGQYSEYWKCRHGHSSQGISAEKFVVFSQNP